MEDEMESLQRQKQGLGEKQEGRAAQIQCRIEDIRDEMFDLINPFLSVITQGAKPIYIEEYGTEKNIAAADSKSVAFEVCYRKKSSLLEVFQNRKWISHWLYSNARREYDAIVFDPSTIDTTYGI